MVQLDYAALRAAPVRADPFPHVVVPRFVPPEELRAIRADLPAIARGGLFPVAALHPGPRVQALAALLEGATFRQAVADKLGLDLDGAPTMVTLRGLSRAKDGRIHTDSACKRVSLLLYLNPAGDGWAQPEGCLRLLRGPGDIEDYAVEIAPVDGTLLLFPNGPTAWHGYRPFVGERVVLQLNYMTSDAEAERELRRHRVSAVVKRLAWPWRRAAG